MPFARAGISGRARELVRQLMEPDPKKRLTAAELLTHPWIQGEDVPERPLPETVERLHAFKTASSAIHGSLLMAALLYQDDVRERVRVEGETSSSSWGSSWGFGGAKQSGDSKRQLRRSTTEGIGMLQSRGSEFNVVKAAFKLFDPEEKGHILAGDLYRTCHQLGFPVSERDVENMLSILAPSVNPELSLSTAPSVNAEPEPLTKPVSLKAMPSRAISYDKFAKMMESSYRRQFRPGDAIFRQGDAVDGFYIVVSGECSVQVSATDDP